jgi:hypothetical protein
MRLQGLAIQQGQTTAPPLRAEAFEALPVAIRNLGPWTGSKEGEVLCHEDLSVMLYER